MLKKKTSNGFTIAEMWVAIAIFSILLVSAFINPYTALKNFREAEKINIVENRFNSILNSSIIDYGVGNTWRIKYTIFFLNTWSSNIDVYNYIETYPIWVDWKPSVIPVMVFSKVQEIVLPKDISFDIPPLLNWKTVTTDDNWIRTLWIKITRPDNQLYAFDWGDSFFQKLDEANVTSKDQLIRDNWNIVYKNAIVDNTNFYDMRPWLKTEYTNFSIDVYDRSQKIWNVILNKNTKKMIFITDKYWDLD